VPCGLAGGLPVGFQLVGRPFEEETLLRLGAAFQLTTPHHRLAPAL
jgi:aspartyl-tRNA(Asn)/glutamyl-tRNA(Gln) amidotransferase subunit A